LKKYLNYGTQLQQYLEAVDTPDDHTAVCRYSRPMPLPLLLRALADLDTSSRAMCSKAPTFSKSRQHRADWNRALQVRAV